MITPYCLCVLREHPFVQFRNQWTDPDEIWYDCYATVGSEVMCGDSVVQLVLMLLFCSI
jgi:hypothetical protein